MFTHNGSARLSTREWRACLTSCLIVAATLGSLHTADGHGIAGNRLFPGTLSFDDPAVSDEFTFTPGSVQKRALDGSAVKDDGVSWELMRLLVPNVALVIDGGALHRNWTALQSAGFDATTLSIKGLLYRNDPHEFLLSAKASWGIGQSGALAVDGAQPNTFAPSFQFGKGFGDLPERFGWLRPFAVTGAFAAEFPTIARSTILGVSPASPGASLRPVVVCGTRHLLATCWRGHKKGI
jgi:hypothetical protein